LRNKEKLKLIISRKQRRSRKKRELRRMQLQLWLIIEKLELIPQLPPVKSISTIFELVVSNNL
jgi:hypothetical protein|tara:strand:+ start:656 stop:844 length:189 start_codon:yes stop_codon:yes gene_type:complete